MRKEESDPKEPDAKPQKQLSELEKLVINAIKEKEKTNTSPTTIEDLDSIIDTLKKFNTNKVKAIRIKKAEKDE